MKLSEYKNEQALEVLGKILDPVAVILANPKIKKAYQDGTQLAFVKALLSEHPHEIITILAILDNTPVDQYEVSLTTLPKKVLEILNDDELKDFFASQGQNLE